MSRKAFMYVDDVIWMLRDINKERPKSIFDNEYLKQYKEAHDKYGIKITFHIFYRTDFYYDDKEFTLSDMTDAYKAEWEAASDWLKFGIHSKQEFPDYPFINFDYEDAKSVCEKIKKEVYRFAGEKSFARGTVIHWNAVSRGTCKALYECGVRMINGTKGKTAEYNGDINSLPYGHAHRLLNNRQPETKTWSWNDGRHDEISRSLCAYNHIEDGIKIVDGKKQRFKKDEETGLTFVLFDPGPCLNRFALEEVEEAIETVIDDDTLINVGHHEQYFYKDYFTYHPDYAKKTLTAAKCLFENDFEFVFLEDLL